MWLFCGIVGGCRGVGVGVGVGVAAGGGLGVGDATGGEWIRRRPKGRRTWLRRGLRRGLFGWCIRPLGFCSRRGFGSICLVG